MSTNNLSVDHIPGYINLHIPNLLKKYEQGKIWHGPSYPPVFHLTADITDDPVRWFEIIRKRYFQYANTVELGYYCPIQTIGQFVAYILFSWKDVHRELVVKGVDEEGWCVPKNVKILEYMMDNIGRVTLYPVPGKSYWKYDIIRDPTKDKWETMKNLLKLDICQRRWNLPTEVWSQIMAYVSKECNA